MIYPDALTCQRVPNPLGLAGSPTFSWKLTSKDRNQQQTAYRIQAASTGALLDTPDLYDSGKVLSSRTLDLPWTAAPLAAYARVFWRVTVWDQDDVPAISSPSWFETGPLPENFTGKTIFAGEAADVPYEKTAFATTAPALDMPAFPAGPPEDADAPMPDFSPKPRREHYFRKSFSLPERPIRARLYLSASGPCLVWLNGTPAGPWLNDPSPDACSFRPLYTVYDLDGQLHAGENVLGLSCSGANITVLLFLALPDGSRQVISTDTIWQWAFGPTTLLGTGGSYDARLELSGWTTPEFDASGWPFCQKGPDPLTEIYPNQMPVQTVAWREHPAAMERTPWGSWRCRASRITAGRIRFRLHAPAGTTIRIHMAEKELHGGEIIRGQDPLGHPEEGGADTFLYTFAGTGVEEWAQRYSYSGIGWLEIEGYPGDIAPEDLWFEAVYNQAAHISHMESSEPMFETLHDMLISTIENNFHGVLTTCPPYEKGPADGDTSVTLPAFLWNLDCLPIIRRLDDDFAATVRFRRSYTEEDLRQDLVAPGMIRSVPEWSSMLVHNCRNLYGFSGLISETEQFYSELQRYFGNELAELHYSDYLVDSFFGGDWNSPEGNGSPEGGTLSGTCYEYFSLRTMAELCRLTGQPQDALLYEQEAQRCKNSINEKCLRGDAYETAKASYFPQWGPPPWDGDGAVPQPVGYRQTSNILPLAFGIVPEEARPAVIHRLIEEIHRKDDHLDTGFVGAKYLLTTLSDLGYVDLAYTIATKRDYPSWGYWLEQGATSCWEHWGKFSRSQDHFFLAAGLEDWFRETLGGIRDQEDGFARFTIRPQLPAAMTRFAFSSDTVRGIVSSRWEKTPEGLCFTVEIPVGAEALVIPPPLADTTLLLNGVPTEKTEFHLGSGTYLFERKK